MALHVTGWQEEGSTTYEGDWAATRTVFHMDDVLQTVTRQPLITSVTTVLTTRLGGDGSLIKLPWVDSAAASLVAEGESIPDGDAQTKVATIFTVKTATVTALTNELATLESGEAQESYLAALFEAVLNKADEAFLAQPAPEVGELWPPAGIIHQIQEGGNVIGAEGGDPTENLDGIAIGLAVARANGGRPEHLIMNPLDWGALSILKQDSDSSNVPLLGSLTDHTELRLLGLNVVLNAAMPQGQALAVDQRAIASAVGPIHLAVSEHHHFLRDARSARVTFRSGAALMHPKRCCLINLNVPPLPNITVGDGEGEGEGGGE